MALDGTQVFTLMHLKGLSCMNSQHTQSVDVCSTQALSLKKASSGRSQAISVTISAHHGTTESTGSVMGTKSLRRQGP